MLHISFAAGGINHPFDMTQPEGKKKQSKQKASQNTLNVG
jgi:hypothetical protein